MIQFVTTFINEMRDTRSNDRLEEPATLCSNMRIIEWLFPDFELAFYQKSLSSMLNILSLHLIDSVAALLALVLKKKASKTNTILVYHLNPPLPAVFGSNNIHYGFNHCVKRTYMRLLSINFRSLSTSDVIVKVPHAWYKKI